MSKPDVTILFLSRGGAARAEFAGDTVLSVRRAKVNGERGLGSLVESAAGGEKLRGPVWLLSDEVYSQALALPVARGMRDDETRAALALEAQVLSGIPAADSALGWRHLPGDGREREYWISQLHADELDQAIATVRRLGGRLAGVVHPAGVPRKLSNDPSNGRWRRVEYWSDLGASVEDVGEAGIVARLRRGAPPRGRNDQPPAESLYVTGSAAALAQPATRSLRLDDDQTLGLWLGAWADVLRTEPGTVPVVRPVEKPLSTPIQASVFFGALLLVGAFCGLDAWRARVVRDREKADLAAARAPIDRFQKLQASNQALEKKAAELRAQSAIQPAGLAPGLPGQLLELLSTRCPSGMILESLDFSPNRSVIRGLCQDAGLAERLADELNRDLHKHGRRASAISKKLRTDGPSAGLYEFEIQVVAKS